MVAIRGTNASENFIGTNNKDVIDGQGGNDSLSGLDGNDILDGGSGNDTLNGGNGNDKVTGAGGNDTYLFDSDNFGNDTLNDSGGIDTLDFTALTGSLVVSLTTDLVAGGPFQLAQGSGGTVISSKPSVVAGLENVLGGGSNDSITGNNLGNSLNGGGGNDSLIGLSGNDTLNGGIGDDTMTGGIGDDTYVVSSVSDVINENADAGDDTVSVGFAYTLGTNLENLELTGSANITGTGNELNNLIVGNSGNNTLDGAGGDDTLAGGIGDDTYLIDNSNVQIIENSGEGTDFVQASVSYTLSADIENITLTGTDHINATGNAQNNTLIGNSGDNFLDGGAGIDTMIGGLGNDSYGVDDLSDSITENPDEGFDIVESTISYTLATNFERLDLNGTDNISGTGTTLNDVIFGNTGNNTLIGLDGNDSLRDVAGNDSIEGGNGNDTITGGVGIDTMIGGDGNDEYSVDDTGDVIIETLTGGTDHVFSSISYTLGSNLENLFLLPGGNINGAGNELNNAVGGSAGNNSISGLDGNDTLDAAAGDDTLLGGIGNDILFGREGNDSLEGGSGDDDYFYYQSQGGQDIILDSSGDDNLFLPGFATTDVDSWSAQDNNENGNFEDLFIDLGNGDTVSIQNYFDDSTSDLSQLAPGTGTVEELFFDDTALDFNEVAAILAT